MERCYGQINDNGDINGNLREIYSNLTKLINAGEQTKVGRFASLCQDSCHYNDPKHGTAVNLSKLNEGLKNIINPPVTTHREVSPSPKSRPSRPSTPAQRPSYEKKKLSKKDSNGKSKSGKGANRGSRGGATYKSKSYKSKSEYNGASAFKK